MYDPVLPGQPAHTLCPLLRKPGDTPHSSLSLAQQQGQQELAEYCGDLHPPQPWGHLTAAVSPPAIRACCRTACPTMGNKWEITHMRLTLTPTAHPQWHTAINFFPLPLHLFPLRPPSPSAPQSSPWVYPGVGATIPTHDPAAIS